jgi:hypothetical protein
MAADVTVNRAENRLAEPANVLAAFFLQHLDRTGVGHSNPFPPGAAAKRALTSEYYLRLMQRCNLDTCCSALPSR